MTTDFTADANPLLGIRRRGVQVVNEDLPASEEFGEKDLIELSIDEVNPFELNPRRSVNPRYADIKDSIYSDGLLHPPNVTRRSPNDPWIIADGGNTRLAALHELRHEAIAAGKPDDISRFSTIICRKVTWTSERKTIGFHVSENDLRGDMLFIDKAIAFSNILDDAYPGIDWRELSQAEKAATVCDSGWFIRQDHVSRYQQVLEYKDTLSRYLNRQDKPGQRPVGRDEFRWVIALHKRYLSIAKESHGFGLGPVASETITNTWRETLLVHDSETLNSPESQRLLKRELNTKLSQKLGLSIEDIEAIVFDLKPADDTSAPPNESADTSDTSGGKSTKPAKKTRGKLTEEFKALFAAIAEKIGVEHTIDPDSGFPVAIPPSQQIDPTEAPERAMAFLCLYVQPHVAAGLPIGQLSLASGIDGLFSGGLTHAMLAAATHRAMILTSLVTTSSHKSLQQNVAQLEHIALELCASSKRSKRGR